MFFISFEPIRKQIKGEGMDAILVFVTTSSENEANNIASKILDKRKAACVNIIPNINSFFWWEGKKDFANEFLLLIKTKFTVLEDLIEIVKKNHSYEVPEIIAIPIIEGNKDYLKWIQNEVK